MFKRIFFEKGKEQKKAKFRKRENSRECSHLPETPLKMTAHEEKARPLVKSSDVTISSSRDSKGPTLSKVGHKLGKLRDGS